MSRYLAQVESGVVVRVIVCDDIQWATERLGGTWVETADPYAQEQAEGLEHVVYCGPGYGVDESFPERFAPPWVQPVATEDGWTTYPKGALVWHNGRIWRSTVDGNVWRPGVSAWHDAPQGGETPRWVAPTGAHDVYPLGFIVQHNGKEWESLIPANATEPGSDPRWWKDLSEPDEPDQPDAWVQPTGAHNAYQTGDEVTHPDRANTMGEGSTTVWVWRSNIDANTTEPGQDGTFHRWWEPVRVA